jgi:hypothetical protein
MDRMKKNHGTVTESIEGAKLVTSYGKDGSDYTGSAAAERGGKMGGSITNLSHSLSGTSANQKGS